MFLIRTRHWWMLLLRGVLAIMFGAMSFAWPRITVAVLVLLFGAYVLVDGAFAVAAAVTAPKELKGWWALLIEGLLGVGAGIVTFVWPAITALVLLWLIALWAVLTGVFEIAAAVQLRKIITGEWLLVVSGILSLLFGLLLIVMPVAGALAIVWLIGAYAVVFGILLCALAIRLKTLSKANVDVAIN